MDERVVRRREVGLITMLFGEFDIVSIAFVRFDLILLIDTLVLDLRNLLAHLRSRRDLHAHLDLLGLLVLYLHLHDLSGVDRRALQRNLRDVGLLELVGEVDLVLVNSLLGDDLLLVQVVDEGLFNQIGRELTGEAGLLVSGVDVFLDRLLRQFFARSIVLRSLIHRIHGGFLKLLALEPLGFQIGADSLITRLELLDDVSVQWSLPSEPGMREHLTNGRSVQWFSLQHARDQVLHLGGQVIRATHLVMVRPEKLRVTELNRIEQSVFLRVGLTEREPSRDHHEEEHANGK